MKEIIMIVAVVGVWVLLQYVIFPKFGIET